MANSEIAIQVSMILDSREELRGIVFKRNNGIFQYYMEEFRDYEDDPDLLPAWRPKLLSGLFESLADAESDLKLRVGAGARLYALSPKEFEIAHWGMVDPVVEV